MAAKTKKMQMVLGHDNNIIISNCLQLPATAAFQPAMKCIHPIIS